MKHPEPAHPPSPETKAEPSVTPHITHLDVPPPDFLLAEAMNEPDRRLLEEYGQVIRTLRDEKRFTFREIAEWLKEYGFDCDHNAVYREYTRGLSEQDEQAVAIQDAMEESD